MYLHCKCFHAVLDFGANGDGVTDNVKFFQNSLNAASAGGIGKPVIITYYQYLQCALHITTTVFVPPGQYAFKTNTTIVIPRGVTLQGTYR